MTFGLLFMVLGFTCTDLKQSFVAENCCQDIEKTVTNSDLCHKNDYMHFLPQVNPEDLSVLASIPSDVGIYALNLIKYRDATAYAKYGEFANSMLPKVGASVVNGFNVLGKIIGPKQYAYDSVVTVFYPSLARFQEYAGLLSQNASASAWREDGLLYQELIFMEAGF